MGSHHHMLLEFYSHTRRAKTMWNVKSAKWWNYDKVLAMKEGGRGTVQSKRMKLLSLVAAHILSSHVPLG